jgi:hypothetical protein
MDINSRPEGNLIIILRRTIFYFFYSVIAAMIIWLFFNWLAAIVGFFGFYVYLIAVYSAVLSLEHGIKAGLHGIGLYCIVAGILMGLLCGVILALILAIIAAGVYFIAFYLLINPGNKAMQAIWPIPPLESET